MNDSELNAKLISNQDRLRSEVEAWAQLQYSCLNAAYARADFEAAVLEAVRGDTVFWQQHTGSDLCSALGHCTLPRRLEPD